MAKLILIVLAMLLAFAAYETVSAGYHNKGHVHVNVWRGPSKGYKKHKFAPWGYYAKLPADDSPKYHHYG